VRERGGQGEHHSRKVPFQMEDFPPDFTSKQLAIAVVDVILQGTTAQRVHKM